jgi:hypothetical protein
VCGVIFFMPITRHLSRLKKQIRREQVSLREQSGSAQLIARMDACLTELESSLAVSDAALDRSAAQCRKLLDMIAAIGAASDKSSRLAIQAIDSFIDAPWDETQSVLIADKIGNLIKNVCVLTRTISNISTHISSFDYLDEIEILVRDLDRATEMAFDYAQKQSSATDAKGE